MMGRLIDAGLLLDNLSGRLESMKDYDAVKDVLNNMPTAYDVDAVAKSRKECEQMDSYWNEEDSENIVCPYCGEEYEPTYEDTYIGNEVVDCFTEDTNEYVCDKCGKKFTMYGYQAGWRYCTETIDGQATDEEIENLEREGVRYV